MPRRCISENRKRDRSRYGRYEKEELYRVIFNMKYKYIWVVLYSQWFDRIYRVMYIICRTLHVEHSHPGDSHTICTHAHALPHACKTRRRRDSCASRRTSDPYSAHALVNSWFMFFFLFLSFYSLNLEYSFFWRSYNCMSQKFRLSSATSANLRVYTPPSLDQ